MKIALCLSGGLRNFKDTYYSFKHFLLDEYEVDVFFYGLENKEGVDINTKDLVRLYNPKKYKINNTEFYNSIHCKYNIPSSFYGFYNVLKCNELKSLYENENEFKYDIVIRSRTDYFWFRYLTDEEIFLSKSNIITPEEWSFKGVNYFARSDIFAMGSSKLMDEYSNLFNRLDEYCNSITFHPESLCGYHLLKNNIPNIENKRSVIVEYPSKRVEKYISPYTFIKYFEDIDIQDETDFLKYISNKRKNF
jgi:hypothetical protein